MAGLSEGGVRTGVRSGFCMATGIPSGLLLSDNTLGLADNTLLLGSNRMKKWDARLEKSAPTGSLAFWGLFAGANLLCLFLVLGLMV